MLLFSLHISQRPQSMLRVQARLSARVQSSLVGRWGREAVPAHIQRKYKYSSIAVSAPSGRLRDRAWL